MLLDTSYRLSRCRTGWLERTSTGRTSRSLGSHLWRGSPPQRWPYHVSIVYMHALTACPLNYSRTVPGLLSQTSDRYRSPHFVVGQIMLALSPSWARNWGTFYFQMSPYTKVASWPCSSCTKINIVLLSWYERLHDHVLVHRSTLFCYLDTRGCWAQIQDSPSVVQSRSYQLDHLLFPGCPDS